METTFLTLGVFLIVGGLMLLLADLFVPSGGVLIVLGLGGMGVGIAFLFRYDTTVGVWALVATALALPVGGVLLFKLWAYTPLARMAAPGPAPTDADIPFDQGLQLLRGRHGKTLTALRPAGMVEFDGRRVDSLTEGMMVESGQWVRCVEVRGGTVIVRPVDKPDTIDLETTSLT